MNDEAGDAECDPDTTAPDDDDVDEADVADDDDARIFDRFSIE